MRHSLSLVGGGVPQLRVWLAHIRKGLPPDPAAEGADALCRRAGTVLLPVEENRAPRRPRQPRSPGKEEVRSSSGHH